MNDISDVLFTITSMASGQYLTVTPEKYSQDGLEIQVHSRLATSKAGPGDVAAQCWTLIPVDQGVFKIMNFLSKQVLEVRGASTVDHAVIQQNTDQGTMSQHWVLVLVDDSVPSYIIFSELSKKVIDVPYPSTEEAVTIQQYARKLRQAANQHWMLKQTTIQFGE